MANVRRKTASGNVAMVNWFQKQPNVQIVSLIPIEKINLPQNDLVEHVGQQTSQCWCEGAETSRSKSSK